MLLIEDDLLYADLLKNILRQNDFSVTHASTGEQAIQLAHTHDWDVIVCDILLPKTNGYEICKEIKKIPQLANKTFIFISALSSYENIRKGMDLVADDYFVKPFSCSKLIKSIKYRLDKSLKTRLLESPNELAECEKLINLSAKEQKIFKLISQGYTSGEISEKLFISKKTVENHRYNISQKLNLSGHNSLLTFALKSSTATQ